MPLLPSYAPPRLPQVLQCINALDPVSRGAAAGAIAAQRRGKGIDRGFRVRRERDRVLRRRARRYCSLTEATGSLVQADADKVFAAGWDKRRSTMRSACVRCSIS